MDPQATHRMMLDSFSDPDYDEALYLAEALLDWYLCGGFCHYYQIEDAQRIRTICYERLNHV